jgi:hypothetical protein
MPGLKPEAIPASILAAQGRLFSEGIGQTACGKLDP